MSDEVKESMPSDEDKNKNKDKDKDEDVVTAEDREAEIERRRKFKKKNELRKEIEEKREKKARNLLKTREVLKSADEPIRLYIEELSTEEDSYFIDYCKLSYSELHKLLEIEDIHDRNLEELYLRLHKADPEVSQGDIKGLPGNMVNLLLMKIGEREDRFLLPALQRRLKSLDTVMNK